MWCLLVLPLRVFVLKRGRIVPSWILCHVPSFRHRDGNPS